MRLVKEGVVWHTEWGLLKRVCLGTQGEFGRECDLADRVPLSKQIGAYRQGGVSIDRVGGAYQEGQGLVSL